jgi:hypothetical protein
MNKPDEQSDHVPILDFSTYSINSLANLYVLLPNSLDGLHENVNIAPVSMKHRKQPCQHIAIHCNNTLPLRLPMGKLFSVLERPY